MLTQRSQVKSIVNRFKIALQNRGINVDRVILYGSYAKGTATQYSDIDLIVVSQDFIGMSFEQRCSVLGKAIADVMEPLEPLAFTPEELERLSPLSFVGSIVRDQSQYIELT